MGTAGMGTENAEGTDGTTVDGRIMTATDIAESKIKTGIPVEIPLEYYEGPTIPGTYKPIVRDALTGNFLTYFMIQTKEGAKFFKLYDISEQAIKTKIAETEKQEMEKASPFPQVLDSMATMRLQLKDTKAIVEADYDRLSRSIDSILDPNEKDIASKYLDTIQSEINRILEEEDGLQRLISRVE